MAVLAPHGFRRDPGEKQAGVAAVREAEERMRRHRDVQPPVGANKAELLPLAVGKRRLHQQPRHEAECPGGLGLFGLDRQSLLQSLASPGGRGMTASEGRVGPARFLSEDRPAGVPLSRDALMTHFEFPRWRRTAQ